MTITQLSLDKALWSEQAAKDALTTSHQTLNNMLAAYESAKRAYDMAELSLVLSAEGAAYIAAGSNEQARKDRRQDLLYRELASYQEQLDQCMADRRDAEVAYETAANEWRLTRDTTQALTAQIGGVQ